MLKSDLHLHTDASRHYHYNLLDGLNTANEMAKVASKRGLEAIAFTDHEVLFDSAEANKLSKKYDILVIPGIEMNVNGKHLQGIGISEVRRVADAADFRDMVHEQGGSVIAPHPYDPFYDRGTRDFRDVDAIEVYNGFVFRANNPHFEELIHTADKMNKGKVCGSDAHSTGQLGYVRFLIDSEPDTDAVIKAVKNRKTKVKSNNGTPLYERIPTRKHARYYIDKILLGKGKIK